MTKFQDLALLKTQLEQDLKAIDKTIFDLETNYLEQTL